MTDNCFLCLEKAKKNMCPAGVCKMKCHTKCYRKYIRETKTNDNIVCPVCKSVKTHRYNMRSRKKTTRVDKYEFIRRVKHFLILIERSSDISNKKELSVKMFEFMSCNLWFLEKYEFFTHIIKKKLIQFYIEEDWEYPNQVHKRFFGTYIFN